MLVAGKRGQGKTTFLKKYLAECEPRVLALDPFDDFKFIARCTSLDVACAMLEGGEPFRGRVIPPLRSTRAYGAELFQRIVERGEIRNCLLVLDEVSLWTGTHVSEHLETMILQGRRLGLRMLIACQRIARVPGEMLSECTELVVFKFTRPRDLAVLDDWAEDESLSNAAPKLGVGDCLLVNV